MAQSKEMMFLKVVLMVFAVVAIVYGLGFMVVPGVIVDASGGEPVTASWFRWMGGIIVALGIGAMLAARKPEKQETFVITMALVTLFVGLATIYSWVAGEHSGSNLFIALPIVINLLLSGFLWWGWKRAKEMF